jgi:hypothetical protein
MKMLNNWKMLLRKAWSLRLLALAATLSGFETIAPFAAPWLGQRAFALLMFSIVAAAFVARLLAQKGMTDEQQQ